MIGRFIFTLSLAFFVICPSYATETKLSNNSMPNWTKISSATAKWLWIDVYNASLFNFTGKPQSNLLDNKLPLKLEVCYLVDVDKDDLVRAAYKVLSDSLDTELKNEINKLHLAYSSVSLGDCYALEHYANGVTQMLLNNELIFETDNAYFKSNYFGIWLGNNPLSQEVKKQLLNSTQD